ncbi:hypothetical protein K8I28_13885 [bacterium]|nr:hypothetical protein [bacterium]
MPAKKNVIHSSTDIYYEIGDSGIWILDFNKKRYLDKVSPKVDLFHADYVGDRMEVSRREEIIEILEGRYNAE